MSIDGLPGWLAVASPIAILLVIAFSILLTGRPQRQRDDRIKSDPDGQGHGVQASLPLTDEPEGQAIPDDARTSHNVGGERDEGAASESRVQVEPRSALARELADAESAGDRGRLMQLYLELAFVEQEAGDTEAAKGSLRKLIMIASEAGDAVAHARGRLELGDIAQSQGDLTTACEHWQMARALFDQDARADESREANARMQAHGCPTDWVLTDF